MSRELEKIIKRVYEKWKSGLPAGQEKHPDEEQFAAFMAKELPSGEADWIKKHVLSCAACAEILAVSCKLQPVEELEPPEKLIAAASNLLNKEISRQVLEIFLQIKNKFLEILNTSGDVLVGQELVPAAVLRSRKIKDFREEITILKDFGSIRVEAGITARESESFDLAVVIRSKETQELVKNLRISLFKGGIELESYLTDSGKVIFEHVLLGKYTVEISSLTDKLAGILIDIKV